MPVISKYQLSIIWGNKFLQKNIPVPARSLSKQEYYQQEIISSGLLMGILINTLISQRINKRYRPHAIQNSQQFFILRPDIVQKIRFKSLCTNYCLHLGAVVDCVVI